MSAGALVLLMGHLPVGPAQAGALERAMLGKSAVVDLSRPVRDPDPAAGSGERPAPQPSGEAEASESAWSPAGLTTRLYAPLGVPQAERTVAAIPVRDLLVRAVVVDVTARVATQADYRIGVEELLAWERRHGRIPKESLVLLRTGWMRRWGAVAGESERPPLPGFLPATLAFLTGQRQIRGVGQDSPVVVESPGGPGELGHPVGRAGTLQLENLVNLHRLPARGAKLIVAPMRLVRGSAPARVIAILP